MRDRFGKWWRFRNVEFIPVSQCFFLNHISAYNFVEEHRLQCSEDAAVSMGAGGLVVGKRQGILNFTFGDVTVFFDDVVLLPL